MRHDAVCVLRIQNMLPGSTSFFFGLFLQVVSHPALYPCMTGNIGLLRVFAEAGLMGDDLEGPLLEVAAANAQRAATAFIEAHYIDSRPMERLPSTQQAEKIRRVCNRVDPSSSGYVET